MQQPDEEQSPATVSDYWFGVDSPLFKAIPGFKPREVQQQLAQAIEKAIAEQQVLIAEAGTGTGKTFAYLIPALLSQQRTIISTGTKTLQDQLFFRDIPKLREALAIPAKVCLLKGRSNYICRHRLQQVDQHLFPQKRIIKHLQQIRRQLPRTQFGEVNEINQVPDDSPIWYYVTSTRDNCLGQDCDYYDECYLVKARRKALAADVIVVNHHLLFADLVLKEEGVGELLPNVDLIVLDEAHQVPEIASQFFGLRLSSRQLNELARDTQMEQLVEAKDATEVSQCCDQLRKAVADMRLHLGEQPIRAAWHQVKQNQAVTHSVQQIQQQLDELSQRLDIIAGRSKGLESCWQRCTALKDLFTHCTQQNQEDFIHWYETFSQSFTIYQTPFSIAESFSQLLKEKTWVMTSATLTVDESFSHFTHQLGLTEPQTMCLPSPFDYQRQCLLYVPRELPDPNHPDYFSAIIDAAVPVINANQGRTFFLFTSHRALKIAADLLPTLIDYPLFVQGTMAKDQLLRDFVEHGHGVLLGTYSFWEGVDVKGQTLSCVIIDKLPFQSPVDPVSVAREKALRQQGKNPFRDDQLPKAVLGLKQGVGRLIRDEEDRGVVMVCDPRLVARDYGRIFLKSLTNMQRTRTLETVLSFITQIYGDKVDEADESAGD